MKTLFVYNPYSGQENIKSSLYDVINVFSSKYDDLNIHASIKEKDIERFVRKYGSNYNLIVVSGGDGTLSETVNALMKIHSSPLIGYIPTGTTNDYAYSLGLSSNCINCAKSIVKAKSNIKVDVGQFNNRYFVYIAAFGVFTETSYKTPHDLKRSLGHLAYILNGVTSLANIKSYKITIKTKDESFSGQYIFGMITNALSFGGVYRLNKNSVNLSDGLFEVVLVKQPRDLLEMSEITNYFIDSKRKTDLVQEFKINQISFITSDIMPWTLDGEYGGSPLNVTIKNHQNRLSLIK